MKRGKFCVKLCQIAVKAFNERDYGVRLVCVEEVPVSYAKNLEDAALSQAERMTKTVRKIFRR